MSFDRKKQRLITLRHIRIILAAAFATSLSLADVPAAPSGGKRTRRGTAFKNRRFVLAGFLVDSQGLPVPNLPVQIQGAQRDLASDPRLDKKLFRVLGEDVTSIDGAYRIAIRLDPSVKKYYVNLFVFGRFDDVHYARPDRIDITSHVQKSDSYLLDYRLANHGEWPKIRKILQTYPPKSAKARVIRKYGIAEEITRKKERPGIDTWWYYSKGKNFYFKGSKLVGAKTFSPVLK